MPIVERPDGVEIHWQERGQGPLVVITSYWSMHPSMFDNVVAELEGDHRVVLYDDRGVGASTRQGPYDMETSSSDLAAVIEAAGPPAVLIATADGSNRAVRVLAGHPELVAGIVCVGGAPVGRKSFPDAEAMAASEGVVAALLSQVETDYRGALRGILASTNPQMSDDELRERVSAQCEYAPQETAVARMHAWVADDPLEFSLQAGDRLWVAVSERLGGGWFPAGASLRKLLETTLPEARVFDVDDGLVSRPDQTAATVRQVVAHAKALEPAE
jgi:pimeloyl-ACP methyl ester carboxylesterase